MTDYILPALILITILLLLIVYAKKGRKEYEKMIKSGKYPEGHFVGQWMGIGVALGVPFGLSMGNIALGIPFGLAIGVAIGYTQEAKYKKKGKIRPLTNAEKQKQKIGLWIGLILGLVLAIIVMSTFILNNSIDDFNDCVRAGYPVMESYPRQCSDGIQIWTEEIIGGDRDEHGCYLMAGYNWCEAKQKCVRYWEEGCGDCETDSDCQPYGQDGDCNCGCYNENMMPTNSGGECFCAAPSSCECVENKCVNN